MLVVRGNDKTAEHEKQVNRQIAVAKDDAGGKQQFAVIQHDCEGTDTAQAIQALEASSHQGIIGKAPYQCV